MEVLSPPSTGREPGRPAKPCRIPTKRAAVADAHAPSTWLPLGFILTGVVSLLAACVWLVWQPELLSTYHYNQYGIAATHLVVLGWICSVLMGAMYQLVPVALETRLFSERLARWHLALHAVGFTGMVAMFQVWNLKQVGHFGSILAVGAGLFVWNLGRTLARLPRWNLVAAGIASALFWLSLTMLAGLFLASAKCWPQINPFAPIAAMHAHAHLGGAGFFLMMMVAVSYKLVPLFALSEVQSPRRAAASLVLLNAGVAGVFVTVLTASPWKPAFALVVAAGLLLHGLEIHAILRARKRRALDWGLKYFVTAIGLLGPVTALGLLLSWPDLPATTLTTQLENVYGLLAFLGVVTLAILGMLYKIVPFLVWYVSYSKAVGLRRAPSLGDLYSPGLQAAGYWLFLLGLSATGVATAAAHSTGVRLGAAVLLAGLLMFGLNLGRMLSHLVSPERGGTAT